MKFKTDRRGLLRGALNGAAVAVALPFLDLFLDGNGEALAATRAPLPLRFGTWFWGCGYTPQRWIPKTLGANYDLPPDLEPLKPFQSKLSILSRFHVQLDGASNDPHFTGLWGFRTGTAAGHADPTPPSFDVLIADVAGNGTRFRSLELACTGDAKVSYSRRGVTAVNPPETSVAALYMRLFGPGFQDPNAADFKPSTEIMARKSVLSVVTDDRKKLMAHLGASDRARMDEYFTSLRQVEDQLALQLRKPPPAEACVIPEKPREVASGTAIDQAQATNQAMARLLAIALACNQTKIFNLALSESASSLRKPGTAVTFHQLTHEELVDRNAGYQVESAFFTTRVMEIWAEFLAEIDGVKEGAGTLLDNCLIVAHSDTSEARTHDVTNLPVMIAGRAGGKLKGGLHIDGGGEPVTRIGLTAQQLMGVQVERWGSKSMETSKPVAELFA